jgi:hypothetical protein
MELKGFAQSLGSHTRPFHLSGEQKMIKKHQLSPRQQKAIQTLLTGHTKSQTAAAVGVAPRTLSRWLADPTFHAALTEVMTNTDARDPDRLRAASLVIHRGLDLIQQKQLIERIATLEAKTNVSQEP